jgi:glycosyltransferase involved in cell wall biosynthesis
MMVGVLDLLAAPLLSAATLLLLLLPIRRRPADGNHLLVLDASYDLTAVRSRKLETAIEARDVAGRFGHVWSVHPMVGADIPASPSTPVVAEHRLHARHTFIEATITGGKRLRRYPTLAFVWSQLLLIVRLRRLLRSQPITAIRVGDPYYLGLLGLGLARAARLPFVIRINGNHDAIFESTGLLAYPRLFRRRSVEKQIDRFTLPRADLVFAPNADYLAFATRNGARADRTVVVPYGNLLASAHFADPASRPTLAELPTGRPLLICVSRLEPVKHTADVLDVLIAVRAVHPDATALIVGDGSLREAHLAAAHERGLDDALVLPGNRDQDWLASALAAADVVVAPMMGRALAEAALSATPIVAYDVDWHAELLTDGSTGRLVPFRDQSAMAVAVLDLLADPDGARAIGRRGRAHALATMAPEVVAAAEAQGWELLGPSRHAVRRR